MAVIKKLLQFLHLMDNDDPDDSALLAWLAEKTGTYGKAWVILPDANSPSDGVVSCYFRHKATGHLKFVTWVREGGYAVEDQSGWTVDGLIQRLTDAKNAGLPGDTIVQAWDPNAGDWAGLTVMLIQNGGPVRLYTDEP